MAERFGRRAIDHFAFRVKSGIMTGTNENPVFLVPIHSAGKMRTAARQDEDIIGGFRLAQQISAVVAGSPFPAVDLGNSEGEGVKLANRDIFQFADYNGIASFILPQRRSNQVSDNRNPKDNANDTPYYAGGCLDEIPAADPVRTRHAHLLDVFL
jgi:hypothetical protein